MSLILTPWLSSDLARFLVMLAIALAGTGCDSMVGMDQRFGVRVVSIQDGRPVEGAVVTAARWASAHDPAHPPTTGPVTPDFARWMSSMASVGRNTAVTDESGRASLPLQAVAMGSALSPPRPEALRRGFVGDTMAFQIRLGSRLDHVIMPNAATGQSASGEVFRVFILETSEMRP